MRLQSLLTRIRKTDSEGQEHGIMGKMSGFVYSLHWKWNQIFYFAVKTTDG